MRRTSRSAGRPWSGKLGAGFPTRSCSIRTDLSPAMSAPTIYFLRHGETEWNALGRLQGIKDVPLNARGRGQAVQAARILADLFARDGKDRTALPYVSSPRGRARQTMELVRGTLELPVADYGLDDRL